MNNTKTTTLALVAVFMVATLVVGTIAATAITTQPAFAAPQKKPGHDDNKKTRDNGSGNSRNGNAVTIEECKNRGSASGFDTALDQECENLICTHPGDNATCVQEESAAVTTNATTPTPAKLTCEECLTKFLNAEQRRIVTGNEQFCAALSNATPTLEVFEIFLARLAEITGQPIDVAGLIQCLQNAGIVFPTGPG
jgi:hypothetical protein